MNVCDFFKLAALGSQKMTSKFATLEETIPIPVPICPAPIIPTLLAKLLDSIYENI